MWRARANGSTYVRSYRQNSGLKRKCGLKRAREIIPANHFIRQLGRQERLDGSWKTARPGSSFISPFTFDVHCIPG